MKRLLPIVMTATTLPFAALTAQAEGNRLPDALYIGAGFSQNVIDSPWGGSEDATGYSLFGGMEFDNSVEGLTSSVEIGYSDTGDFYDNSDSDINGPWAALVGKKSLPEIDPRLSVLGRIGLDLGDDDGLLLGAGVGFDPMDKLGLRAEFINKDASSVYQISALLHF